MNRHISDERRVLEDFRAFLPIEGIWEIGVHRANPAGGWNAPQVHMQRNVILTAGMDEMAALIAGDASSAVNYLAVGTVTATASTDSTNFGEVVRKAGHTVGSSNEYVICAATYGGAADSVTSLALETAAIGNHASSGQGELFNMVTGVSATLADSDLLSLTARIRVGSHG